MHVLFVTSEVATEFKLGGLGDVSYSLPIALSRRGIHVTVAMPFYKVIDSTGVKGVGDLAVDYAGEREVVFLFSKKLRNSSVELLLFRHHRLHEYQGASITETFAFFCKAVSTYYLYGSHLSKFPIDIVHCHDWHAACVPLLIGEGKKIGRSIPTIQSKQAHTIVTIHNLLYQGVADIHVTDSLGAPRELFHTQKTKKSEQFSFLREGLEYADRVTTVSPTYAKEIIATRHEGLVGDVLKRRASSVVGLLNGLDTTIWDPATDPSLSHHYNATTVDEKKVTIKADLQRELGLPQTRSPLIAFVGRLEPRQKGIDIIIDALSELLPKKEMQMVILGTGDRDSCEKLVKLALKHKDKFVFKNAFDEPLARRIYAGADIFLVPSKFEPCGLTQMIAMRYGTVPVVRKTGGLADSVDDGKTGFVFEHYSGAALAEAIMRAVHMWETDEVGWKTIIQAAMHADFSWHKSAALYIDLYRDVQKG